MEPAAHCLCALALPDVLQLWLDSCLLCVRRAVACFVFVLMHAWQVCRGLKAKEVNIPANNRQGGTDSQSLFITGGGIYLCTFFLLQALV